MPEESSPTPEKEGLPKLLNFESLTEEKITELKERLKNSKGRMSVFIHPYFSEDDSIETDVSPGNHDELLAKMRNGLPKVLSLQKEKTAPILIFQEAEKLQELEELLEEVINKDAYVLPTKVGDPTPNQGDWQKLCEKLKELGVTEITLSGMNLAVWVPDDISPRLVGCLAGAAKELSKEFNINLSRLTYPNSKEDYDEWGGRKGPEDHKH